MWLAVGGVFLDAVRDERGRLTCLRPAKKKC
jgi:hypothetical protein